jgi:4-hydroxy-tetrahydrodipicolinate reductase
MRIIILGLGKVGTKINNLCENFALPVGATIAPHNPRATHKKISEVTLTPGDTVIDFSTPDSVLENVAYIAQRGANIVMGTTGWDRDKEKVKALVAKSKIGFAYTPNYMPEVNIFWELTEFLAARLSELSPHAFHAHVFEKRLHTKKSASGTAKNIATILSNQKNLIFEQENNFLSTLSGSKPLDLTVEFSSESDSFSLHFESKDSEKDTTAYAEMAIRTAKWLENKQGFFELTPAMIGKINSLKVLEV